MAEHAAHGEQAVRHQVVAVEQRRIGVLRQHVGLVEFRPRELRPRQRDGLRGTVQPAVLHVVEAARADALEQAAGAAAQVAEQHAPSGGCIGQQVEHHVVAALAVGLVGPQGAHRGVAMAREGLVVELQQGVFGSRSHGGKRAAE